MAIATVGRESTRSSGVSEPRFKLVEEICRTGDLQFWKATDRRTGKPCVVRVIDAGREESARRLGELHRERLLAERIAHPAALRPDVPLIEGERIYQLVQPEPAKRIGNDPNEGRLALLNQLAMVAAALAEAHARGVFHGALSRDCLLRSPEGRAIVQGFTGDAANAVTARDGAVADHGAFVALAQELLAPTGGPPPRLRRYFARELAVGAPRAAIGAMAALAEELRDSLEDTFPWPAAGSDVAAAPIVTKPPAVPKATPARSVGTTHQTGPAPRSDLHTRSPRPAKADREAKSAHTPKLPNTPASPATAPTPVTVAASSDGKALLAPALAAVHPSARGATSASPGARQHENLGGDVGTAPVIIAEPRPGRGRVEAPAASDAPSAGRSRRSWRPWIAAAVLLAVLVAGWQYGQRRHAAGAGESSREASRSSAPAVVPDLPPAAAGRDAVAPAVAASAPVVSAAKPPQAGAPAPPVAAAAPATSARNLTTTARPVRRNGAPVEAEITGDAGAERPRDAAAAQQARSRIANLVAGGNRALNALEPQLAAEAFAQALALSPDDRAANEGSQRARRLLGAAALVRDAREAAVRGEHARAVQGFSQALANDPRNRGLAEALAASRRSLAGDATGTLLAAGHEALGAGRLEQARDAFERALQIDPRNADARRAAQQAAAAMLLRDTANERRLASVPPEG